jgi:O-antigen/teichoic acid export membrane protein
MRLSSSFIRHSAVLTLTTVAASLISAIYVSLVGRMLGPARYAVVASLLSLAAFFMLALGPLETGIAKFAANFHGEGARGKLATLIYGTLRRLAAALGIFVVLWLPLVPLVRRWLRIESVGVLLAFAAFVLLWFLISVPRGTMRGDHRFFAVGMNQTAESVLRLAAGLLLLRLGLGPTGALLGYAAGVGAALAIAMWQMRDLGAEPRTPIDMRRLYAFSVPLLLAYFYFQFVTTADMLVAKRFLPPRDAGVYGAASTLARLLYVASAPVLQVLFSRINALHAQRRSSGEVTLGVLLTLTAGMGLSNLVPWFWGERLMTLIFGPAYAGGGAILGLLWAATAVLVVESAIVFSFLGVERTRGTGALLIPCGAMVLLLARWHGTGLEVARCTLITTVSGLLPLAYMGWRAGRANQPRRSSDA